jgi:4-hydroxy-2-oxoheptanedioate aldolase
MKGAGLSMRKNVVKQKIRAGQPVLGSFVNFSSPAVVEILGYCGLDFVIVDAEHGAMDPMACEEMVRAADVVGLTPIIRVAINLQQNILRYLDTGALGVQMPMINTRADAELAVRSVKYYPLGRRGLAGTRAAQFGLVTPLSEYVKQANDETLVITHVETMEAVENLPQVLEVEGIDVVFIGPTDLSQAMGYPGRPQEPVVQETIDRVIKQVQASGKAVGTICSSGDQAKRLIDRGVLYIATTGISLLSTAAREFLRTARA